MLCILLCLSLQACGFSPIYAEGKEVQADLSSVRVVPVKFGRAGQVLQTELERVLNPQALQTDPQYRLTLNLSKRRDALGIEQNREVTRYNLVVTARYTLQDIKTGKKVLKGRSQIISGFDAVASDFATYTIEEDTLLRIMEEIAQDIRFQLAGKFLKQQHEN